MLNTWWKFRENGPVDPEIIGLRGSEEEIIIVDDWVVTWYTLLQRLLGPTL